MDSPEQLGMSRGTAGGGGGGGEAIPPHTHTGGGLWQNIKRNPHQFLLVLVGVATLYITYRIFKGNSASSASVPAFGAGSPNWLTALTGGGSVSGPGGVPTTPTNPYNVPGALPPAVSTPTLGNAIGNPQAGYFLNPITPGGPTITGNSVVMGAQQPGGTQWPHEPITLPPLHPSVYN
jgi:hypothetical protein